MMLLAWECPYLFTGADHFQSMNVQLPRTVPPVSSITVRHSSIGNRNRGLIARSDRSRSDNVINAPMTTDTVVSVLLLHIVRMIVGM
jgi:hypothetical protein